jgi:translation initiation factor 4A
MRVIIDEADMADFQTNIEDSVEKFEDLVLKEEVMRGIFGYGFVKPSPIQQKGILPLIQGKDTIAQVFYILNNKLLS